MPLRKALMPAQLVWMCHHLSTVANKNAEALQQARARLLLLLASTTFLDTYYVADVADALLMVLKLSFQLDGDEVEGGAPKPFALPALSFGSSPEPAAAPELLKGMARTMDRLRPDLSAAEAAGADEAYDPLSFCVYLARAAEIGERYGLDHGAPDALEFGSDPAEARAELVLGRILTNFAPQCDFKASGDAYLHAIVRLRLPAWPVSALPVGGTPFPAAARLLAGGTNDVVRPLIDNGVDPFLKEVLKMQTPGYVHQTEPAKTAEAFAVAACLIGEMCGVKALLVNDLIAGAPEGASAPFVNGDFGGLPQHAYGVVLGERVCTADRPLQALAAWLQAAPPESMENRLWTVASAPEGADLPANPFTKYTLTPAETDPEL